MHDLENRLRQLSDTVSREAPSELRPTSRALRRIRVGRAVRSGAVLATVAALVASGFTGARSLSSDEAVPPADPRPEGIFAGVGGWIAYGDKGGIWAVDPTQPGDPAQDRVRLSSQRGDPRAWSPDGSKLLIVRDDPNPEPGPAADEDLFVLNADGTETQLTDANGFITGGDFSPDGTEVVYADAPVDDDGDDSSIYVIDVKGGAPRLLLGGSRRRYPGEDRSFETALYDPTFSPDGLQIAYFEGMGDWGHSLRVMNSDGTGVRVVVENSMTLGAGHVFGLDWSPDGEHLVFAINGGVYVVGIDGSGLRLVAKEGADPYWSPGGSRVSYTSFDVTTFEHSGLDIATLDSGHVQKFDYGASGPWNPLDP